ncbi:MAG: 4-hydroxy-tetrahydrodipicolinate reductase [Muribaculaceae bacterium]|nr:4-hydroxy-tetrahydrodipicolinate reductase [Muribaculaceae bacterium]
MKIALIGYGKMGHMIESVALSRGHEITCRIDRDNTEDFDSDAFRSSDVAIEFTTPATAAENVLKCFSAGVPVVCGSTGWTDRLPEMQELCREGKGSMIWASNFSVGVNIFMAVNRVLARIMSKFPEYTPSMTEVHHIHKLDHPSGTAITLAEEIIEENTRIAGWQEPDEAGHVDTGNLPIAHERRGEVPGIHTIRWDSEADMIEITHSANSRQGFALGAVLAAEWLPARPGWHTIAEVLDI